MAVFRAWLSSKIAPRMERSASRLLGSGRSSVVSTDIGSFKLFAFSSLYSTLPLAMQDFRSLLGFAHLFFEIGFSYCACVRARRQREWLCMVSEIVAKLFCTRL